MIPSHNVYIKLLDKTFACHFLGLLESHNSEHCGTDVCKSAALLELAGIAYYAEGNGICGMGSKGSAVLAYHSVCIAVVCCDEAYTAH